MRHIRLLPFFFAVPALAQGAVQGFVESFDGTGPFQSIDGEYQGLDVPGWDIDGDGQLEGGGFVIENDCQCVEGEAVDVLSREVIGRGSFSSRVEIRDVDLGDVDPGDPVTSLGTIRLNQMFPPGIGLTLADNIGVTEPGQWILAARIGADFETAVVVAGENVSLSMAFDDATSEITFEYDSDIEDGMGGLRLGPFVVPGGMGESWTTRLSFIAGGTGRANGQLDLWYMVPLETIPGDFNGNGIFDAADIDLLSEQVRTGTGDPSYDLNDDAVVNDLDRQVWVHDLKETFFGDTDLNGTFDSTDLVQVLSFGEYEDDVELNSTWLTGDWNGDGEFTSGDLVVALADGGYQSGPVAAVVPEPASVLFATIATVFAAIRRRGCAKTRHV